MGVWPLLGTLIKLLDHNDLVAGLTALKDNSNLESVRPKEQCVLEIAK